MLQLVVNSDITVDIPIVGTYCEYGDKSYQILKVVIYQEISPESGNSWIPVFTVLADLLPVNDEGDDTGEPVITVDAVLITEL